MGGEIMSVERSIGMETKVSLPDGEGADLNILAVSYMLPPNLFPQAIQIGRLLNNAKANIGVVSGAVSTMAKGLDCYPGFDKRLAFRLEVPWKRKLPATVHRFAYYGVPFYSRSPDEFKGWVPLAEKAVLHDLPRTGFKPDVLVTFGEPMSDHLLGLRLKRSLGIPWVAHFSDPWADNPFRRRYFLSNVVNRRLERQVIEHADMIIFTSSETADLVMSKYPKTWADKARVLHHAYEPSLYGSRGKTPEGRPLVARYLGAFYGKRSPEPLFKALAAMHRASPGSLADLRIELVGHVPPRMFLSVAYRSLPAGMVATVPMVPYSKSLQLMLDADLLLVIDAPEDISIFLPSKLIDYLGAGTPIMAIVPPGASANLVGRLGGEVANPRDPEQVETALAKALETCRRRRGGPTAPWSDPAKAEEYRVDRVCGRFIELAREAMRMRAAP